MHPVADREAAIATIVAYTCGAVLPGTPQRVGWGREAHRSRRLCALRFQRARTVHARIVDRRRVDFEESRQAIAAAMTDPDPPEGGRRLRQTTQRHVLQTRNDHE